MASSQVLACLWLSVCSVQQGLKQQCAAEVAAVQQEVQHRQRQAARTLKAQAEEEAIKVGRAVPLHCIGQMSWLAPSPLQNWLAP